jgi:hypothetical protein
MIPQFIQSDKVDRRMPDHNMALVAARLESFETSFDDLKGDMRKMAEAVTKLAVMEERQVSANQAQERAFNAIKRVEDDVSKVKTKVIALEIAGVDSKRTSAWIDRAVLAIVLAVAMFIAAKAGIK